MDSGLNWDMIKTKTQKSFSECGSSIIARNKLTSLTQKTMATYKYISQFSTLMEHVHGIKPTHPKSKILTSNFIDEFKIHTLKTNFKCKTLTICLHFMGLLLKKIKNKRSENLILALALQKPKCNMMSMQLKAVDVTNVVIMTISSRTALLIEIMTKKTYPRSTETLQ